MAEIWGAAIAAAGVVGGAIIANQGAKKAGNAAAAGSDAAIAEQRRQFDLTRGDTANYRAIGNQAINALGSIYGYSPAPTLTEPGSEAFAGAAPVNAFAAPKGNGFFNSGTGSLLNPATVSSKLGGAGKILDPAYGLFGNLFGNTHGDEKRNLKAFTEQNQIYDLGNGMLGLADGTTFPAANLQKVAGAWYGATYAPDGDQQGWQQRYAGLVTKPAAPAAGTLYSDGAQNPNPLAIGGNPTAPTAIGSNPLAAPDYSAFFKSPDYQFRLTEGTRDIGNSFAAAGGSMSGNALKALTQFNQGLAAGGFNDYFNHNAALAGIGQTATSQSINAGANTANNISNALMNGADARASGIGTGYNAFGNALGTIGGIGYNYFNRPQSGNPYIEPFYPTQRRVG